MLERDSEAVVSCIWELVASSVQGVPSCGVGGHGHFLEVCVLPARRGGGGE